MLQGPQHDGQATGTDRGVLRDVACLGRDSCAGRPARTAGSGRVAGRGDRELRRRHALGVALGRGGSVHHGRAELLRHDLPPQLGERTPCGLRAVSPGCPRSGLGDGGSDDCPGAQAGPADGSKARLFRPPGPADRVRGVATLLYHFGRDGERGSLHRPSGTWILRPKPGGHGRLLRPARGD